MIVTSRDSANLFGSGGQCHELNDIWSLSCFINIFMTINWEIVVGQIDTMVVTEKQNNIQ